MTKISVVGHQNPDTDCTLSAIIMCEYLWHKWYSATPYILWWLNKETEYLLEKYDIDCPKQTEELDTDIQVCLVDHNESSQSVKNFSDLNVTWLVDHHKMKFETESPLYIRVEPICSTASVLYKMFRESSIEISQKTAILMLACIMSDSLMWKSPTTAEEDKKITRELQKIAWVQTLEDFAMPMFEAKSDLWDMPVNDLIQYDYKIFEFGAKRVGIGSLETTNPSYGLGRKQEILVWFESLKQSQNLDMIILCVVDIINEKNTTIVSDWSDAEHLSNIFDVPVNNNLANLWNRVSRKKQIANEFAVYFK